MHGGSMVRTLGAMAIDRAGSRRDGACGRRTLVLMCGARLEGQSVSTNRGPLTVTVAGLLVCTLLVGAARTGMRLPGLSFLPGLGPTTQLDYGRSSSPFAPLTAEFIARTFGSEAGASSGRNPSFPSADDYSTTPHHGAGRVNAVHGLTNDDFERAYTVGAIPFTAKTDATGASRQSAEPRGCAPVSGATVWYRYSARRDLGLIANTMGTRHATSLAVFTGDDLQTLAEVEGACNTSVRGSAYVTFPARAGETYHFQITGVTDSGPLVFNLDPLGTTERVSGGESSAPLGHSISADGRYVAFSSASNDLIEDDGNDWEDVFVRDLETGAIDRVSVHSDGTPGNRQSKPVYSAISADGRYVAFTSLANNLVDDDTNDAMDVFVHDRRNGETTRVSVSSEGAQGTKGVGGAGSSLSLLQALTEPDDDGANGYGWVAMSADGRYVVFDSELTGLVEEDGPGAEEELGAAGIDIFMHDRSTGRTTLVSASANGANGNGWSYLPEISPDGRYVAFTSSATNLLDEATSGAPGELGALTESQVYLRDMKTREVELISVTIDGTEGSERSFGSALSADGRYVAFYSGTPDLVASDRNGAQLDVFVRDRLLRRTELVSLSSSGEQQVGGETLERAFINFSRPAISWDGRYVAFHTDAPLVPGDTDESENVMGRAPICSVQNEDVFVRDRLADTTTRVSDSSSGEKGDGASMFPVMSADGRRIAFVSAADNLAPDRSSHYPMTCLESQDVFVHTFPILR